MQFIDRLKNIWTAVYERKNDASIIIEKYFHPNYEQCINGVTMYRSEYIQHVMEQKKNMVVEHIEYTHFF